MQWAGPVGVVTAGMPAPAPRQSLWSWSLRALEVPEARGALLALQDGHGLNGSLMLWAAWCDRAGLALTDAEATRIVGRIHEMDRYVVRRLREVRRYVDAPRPGYDRAALSALRAEAYRTELMGEQLIQARLQEETLATCALGARPGTGARLARACARALETPVIMADDRGAAGPVALFATLLAHAPPLNEAE